MKTSKSFRLALNILLHSKLRSWLTIIGIVIGVAAVVAIVSIGEGMQQSVESQLGGLGADLITISPGGSRASSSFAMRMSGGNMNTGTSGTSNNLTKKDIQFIKSVENVDMVSGTVSGNGEIYYLGEDSRISITGVDPLSWNTVTTSELESGRFLTTSNYASVIIGSRLANDVFKQPLVLNRVITIEERSFKIVGILKESGSMMGGSDTSVIMPIEAARSLLESIGDEEFDSITVKVEDAELIEETMDAIDKKLMMTRHVTTNTKDYSITSSASMQETISSATETITLFLGAIAAVSLLVGAVGIANTMFTTVLEKTKEIGIMKAIGARNRDIMAIFMMNSALVGVVGGLIGIVLGSIVSSFMNSGITTTTGGGPGGGMMNMFSSTLVTPELLLSAMGIAVGISMLAGIIPAYRASRLKPVDALRYE
ncbi:MAG: ABC transporter permease [Candidatus Aenigmarchaeota archaeon]|nr:ABC transporter permease [Candidatus Aenigmarchaeota archaeon]